MRFKFKLIAAFMTISAAICTSSFAQTETQILDFTKAAKFNDVATVKSLLAKGVSPNTTDSKGDPMLNIAIRDKSDDVITLLLANKSTDVDLSNKFGETPLMIASIDGNLPVVKALVEQRNAQVNHIGWTPLHYACARGQLDVAKYLISKGATIDALSVGDNTPLMMAVQAGNEDLINLLLSKGADLRLKNSQGFTAIDIAVIYEKPWIAEGLSSRWLKLYKQPYVYPKALMQPKP